MTNHLDQASWADDTPAADGTSPPATAPRTPVSTRVVWLTFSV